jgi:DNA-binding MarR family transcriptional regulator
MPSMRHVEVLQQSRVRHGYRMAVLTNWYKAKPYRHFEREYLLNESEGAALFCLGQSAGLSASDICEITGRTKNSISRGVNVLLSRGLVERKDDVRDKRRKILDLTECGYQIFKDTEKVFVECERKMLNALSAEELVLLDQLLSKMMFEVVRWAKPI